MKNCALFLSLFIILIILPACVSIKQNVRINTEKERVENTDSNKKYHTEIVNTPDEEREIGKWKNKSEKDLMRGVLDGDPSAIFWIAIWFYYGVGVYPIDTELADTFFDDAASLGFPPAIERLIHVYQKEKGLDSICLTMVYTHMVISLGHPELKEFYFDRKDKLISYLGINIMREIERVSLHKQKIVRENKTKFDQSMPQDYMKNKYKLQSLIEEDVIFDIDYWCDVYEEKVPQSLEDYVMRKQLVIIEASAEKAERRIEKNELIRSACS